MSTAEVNSSLSETKVRYWVAETFCLGSIDFGKAFFCRRDPEHAAFHSRVAVKDGFLSASLRTIDKAVLLTKARFKLYDKGKLLATQTVEDPHPMPKGSTKSFGFDLYQPDDATTASTWKVIFDFEYEVPLPQAAPSSNRRSASRLQADYLMMLEDSSDADVTFFVGGERIMAHRVILSARCDYYRHMFASGMGENDNGVVEVVDVKPDVFRGLLQYLYAGATPENLADISWDLLVAADKYGLEELKETCESQVCANLNADNVVDALLLASSIDSEKLMARAKVVFGGSLDALMRSEEATEKLTKSILLKLLSHFTKE